MLVSRGQASPESQVFAQLTPLSLPLPLLPLCTTPQLKAGCAVVVLARSRAKFDLLVPILQAKELSTKDLDFISIDLSSTDDIRRAAAEANEWAGGCADILVNNGEFMQQQKQQQQGDSSSWVHSVPYQTYAPPPGSCPAA